MDFKKILLYGGGLLLATTGPISLFSTSDLVANIRKSRDDEFDDAGRADNRGNAVCDRLLAHDARAGRGIARDDPAAAQSGRGAPLRRDRRMGDAALAAGLDRTAALAVAGLPRAAGHRHAAWPTWPAR